MTQALYAHVNNKTKQKKVHTTPPTQMTLLKNHYFTVSIVLVLVFMSLFCRLKSVKFNNFTHHVK
jgi:p-aminobenzoyl-glutamate transporter AbgT